MNWSKILPNKFQMLLILVSLALVALLAWTNYIVSWEISLSIFYLLPIFICVHNVGRWCGLFLSLVCAIVWLMVEFESGRPYSDDLVRYWNGLALFGVFVIFTLLLASVESALHKEKGISRNLESLLTLAPFDQRGWQLHAQQDQPSPTEEKPHEDSPAEEKPHENLRAQ